MSKDITIGDKVQKRTGYKWPGIVVASFKTIDGNERFVVECTVPEVAGALHIYNEDQLIPTTPEQDTRYKVHSIHSLNNSKDMNK